MGTCKTMARVHSIPRVYKLGYHTRTRKTRDLKPAGFPVPVTYPMADGITDLHTHLMAGLTESLLSSG